MVAPAFYLPRLLPEDLLGSGDTQNDLTERFTEYQKRYYVPDELKEIEVGPYSQVCMEYQPARYSPEYSSRDRTPRCKGLIDDNNDRWRSETSYGSANGRISPPRGITPTYICQFQLMNRTGDLLSWTGNANSDECIQTYGIAPPDANHALTGVGFNFMDLNQNFNELGLLKNLRLIFERRDSDQPKRSVLYQPTPPYDLTGAGPMEPIKWIADGSLDYRISGGATGRIGNNHYAHVPFLYLNFAFFPDADSQQRAP